MSKAIIDKSFRHGDIPTYILKFKDKDYSFDSLGGLSNYLKFLKSSEKELEVEYSNKLNALEKKVVGITINKK